MQGAVNRIKFQIPKRPSGFPVKTVWVRPKIFEGPYLDVGGLRIDVGKPDRRYGRTLVFDFPEKGKAIHLKFLKIGEEDKDLTYEYDLMNFFNLKKEEWGLLGSYPHGKMRLGLIPARYVAYSDTSVPLQENSQGFFVFMAYETPEAHDGRNDYTTYLNDPDLSHEEFLRGLRINTHDRMVMARHGLFDLEMIELYHVSGSRRFDWLHDFDSMGVAGQLTRLVKYTLFPNFRLSGPADFSGIYYVGDIVKGADRKIADGRLARFAGMKRGLTYNILGLMGDTELSLALMVPTYLQRRRELDYQRESSKEGTFFQEALDVIPTVGYNAYNEMNFSSLSERLSLQTQRVAEQMAFASNFKQYEETMKPDKLRSTISRLLGGAVVEGEDLGTGWTNDEEYPIPSRNHSLSLTQRDFNWGPEHSANLVQALIRSLYLSTVATAGGILGQDQSNSKEQGTLTEEKPLLMITLGEQATITNGRTQFTVVNSRQRGLSLLVGPNIPIRPNNDEPPLFGVAKVTINGNNLVTIVKDAQVKRLPYVISNVDAAMTEKRDDKGIVPSVHILATRKAAKTAIILRSHVDDIRGIFEITLDNGDTITYNPRASTVNLSNPTTGQNETLDGVHSTLSLIKERPKAAANRAYGLFGIDMEAKFPDTHLDMEVLDAMHERTLALLNRESSLPAHVEQNPDDAMATASQRTQAIRNIVQSKPAAQLKVLVIEDEESQMKKYREEWRRKGVTIAEARNYSEGKTKLRNEEFDLVQTDNYMPLDETHSDTRPLALNLAYLAEEKGTPAIIVTSLGMDLRDEDLSKTIVWNKDSFDSKLNGLFRKSKSASGSQIGSNGSGDGAMTVAVGRIIKIQHYYREKDGRFDVSDMRRYLDWQEGMRILAATFWGGDEDAMAKERKTFETIPETPDNLRYGYNVAKPLLQHEGVSFEGFPAKAEEIFRSVLESASFERAKHCYLLIAIAALKDWTTIDFQRKFRNRAKEHFDPFQFLGSGIAASLKLWAAKILAEKRGEEIESLKDELNKKDRLFIDKYPYTGHDLRSIRTADFPALLLVAWALLGGDKEAEGKLDMLFENENLINAARGSALLFGFLILSTAYLESQDFAQVAAESTDSAMRGGIDLSQQDAAMRVTKDANGGVKVDVDPAEIARVERYGLSEVDPVIIGMRPANIQAIFGVKILANTP